MTNCTVGLEWMRITHERAARIEEAIRKLRAVKAITLSDEDADAMYREVAADVMIDLYEDWRELQV